MIRETEIHDFANASAQKELYTQLLAHNKQDYHQYHAQVVAMNQKIQRLTRNPHDSIADHITATLRTVIHEITSKPTPQDALVELGKGDLTRYLPDPIKGTGLKIPAYETLMSCSISAQEKTAVEHAISAGLQQAQKLITQDAQILSRVKGAGASTGVPGRP